MSSSKAFSDGYPHFVLAIPIIATIANKLYRLIRLGDYSFAEIIDAQLDLQLSLKQKRGDGA